MVISSMQVYPQRLILIFHIETAKRLFSRRYQSLEESDQGIPPPSDGDEHSPADGCDKLVSVVR